MVFDSMFGEQRIAQDSSAFGTEVVDYSYSQNLYSMDSNRYSLVRELKLEKRTCYA